ncbi:MAG: FtsX-like permease family protein [Woeseiaceae bacterium]|nr:FtsX-like permease family protein [Woeseiaceae bacterium]
MKDLYLVLKNLTRKKMRLFLTVFATFIAFMIFGTLTAFQKAFDSGVDLAADDRLIVLNKISFTQVLPIAYATRVRAVENVEAMTHLNWFGGYYQDPRSQFAMFAVDAENFMEVFDELVLSDAEREAWIDNRQGLIAGRAIADTYGWEVGDRIPINSNIFSQRDGRTDWDFDVVGIYEGEDPQTDTNGVYFHYEYFNETQSFGGDFIGFMAVRTSDPSLNETVIKTIDDMFANSPAETETVPEKAFNKAFIEQIGNLSLILTSVVLAAFFVILVIVGNSMILSIRERTGEIGVMKTLGFTSGRIFRMVLAESVLLALIGGVLGVLASGFMITLINSAPIQLPVLVLDGSVWSQAMLFVVALGFITGIVPAMSALRLNIITALSRS